MVVQESREGEAALLRPRDELSGVLRLGWVRVGTLEEENTDGCWRKWDGMD